MMLNKSGYKNKGFTIIELIVSIGILAIVLTAAYQFLNFGNRTYARGINQQDVQSNIRLLSNYITDQVRYATQVKITNITTEPNQSAMFPTDSYIYYNSSDKTIKHVTKYTTKVFQIGQNPSIEFESISSNKDLKFNIYSEKGSQKYNINTELSILNLPLGSGSIDVSEATTGSAIKFISANGYIAEQLRPIAQLGGTNTEKKVQIHFDRTIIGASIVSSTGVTSPSISYSGDDVTVQTTNSNNGAIIVFRVIFGGLDTYGNTYDYIIKYDSSSKWNLS